VKGIRLPDGDPDPWPPANGSYWWMLRLGKRTLYALSPNGMLCCLANHTVTEHEDGTVTVSPSILVTHNNEQDGNVRWHGFLERGIWREC